jgi:hypothetical protein
MNKALRIAIVERGLKQYAVARKVGVGEARFSGFVHERFEPTDDEKKSIARVLRKGVEEIWPSAGEALSA